MSEWFKEHAWRACRDKIPPGFESLSLRHLFVRRLLWPTAGSAASRRQARLRPAGADPRAAVCVHGDVAQLGERLVRNEEVGGSSPLISILFRRRRGLGPSGAFWQSAVLDGEIAVPCCPQSAIAGLNSLPRSLPGSGQGCQGASRARPYATESCQPRQDRKVAAVRRILRVPWISLT
jgi:hypothetical protein